MATLSVVIIARNEEARIGRCIESVSGADEVLVVDTGSDDKTVEIAEKSGARVVRLPFEGFGVTKQKAIELAQCEWILSLDADEVVPPELWAEITDRLRAAGSDIVGCYIPRLSCFLGRWIRHCGWYPDYVLRLFRRGQGRFEERLVHERVHVVGRTGRLENHILHYTDPDLQHYLRKLDRYTDLSSEELFRAGGTAGIFDLVLRPPAIFLKMFFLKKGFLDGRQGLILSGLSAFHVYLKYVKLWHKGYEAAAPHPPSR